MAEICDLKNTIIAINNFLKNENDNFTFYNQEQTTDDDYTGHTKKKKLV